MRKPSRRSLAVPARRALSLGELPPPVFAGPDSPTVSAPAPVFPFVGLGLLLLGASALSARRIPWPAVARPLEAHRVELAAVGVGAIALALLWLNFAVVF